MKPNVGLLGVYDWPGIESELALDILETLPLAAMNTMQIQRIKELLVRVDALEGKEAHGVQ